MKLTPDRERLIIDSQPRKLRIESEIYVTFLSRNFVPVINVLDLKTNREYFFVVSAQSIGKTLYEWISENNNSAMHLEFWINKKTDERSSPYELEMV